jgi:hypothetical protein
VFDKLKVPHLWYPHYGEEVEEMVRLIQKQEILLAYLHEGLSQREIARRHLVMTDPTIADAILDRLVHNAYKIKLTGESMRKIQGLSPEKSNVEPE